MKLRLLEKLKRNDPPARRVRLKLAGFSFGILIILTFLPFLYEIYNLIYFIVVLLGVDLLLVYTMISARRNSGSANLKRLITLLKFDMLIGLFSMYLGIA